MHEGEFITDHEVKIANKVAEVLCGGAVNPGTPVSEQYLLDLEREAFKSLCGEKKDAGTDSVHVEDGQDAEELKNSCRLSVGSWQLSVSCQLEVNR